jgi:hypothetical protein
LSIGSSDQFIGVGVGLGLGLGDGDTPGDWTAAAEAAGFCAWLAIVARAMAKIAITSKANT